MITLIPGHRYKVYNLEPSNDISDHDGQFRTGQIIQFIHKEPVEPGSVNYLTITNGTTNEELLEVLIDRIDYLNTKHKGGKFKCEENERALFHLNKAFEALKQRTANRKMRGVEGKHVV